MSLQNNTELLERRIRILIIILALSAPLLRLVLPQLVRTGDMLASFIYMLPFIAAIPVILHFRFIDVFQPNDRPKISFDVYLFLLFLTIAVTVVLIFAFGIKVKGEKYPSPLANYVYLLATQLKGFSVIVLMVKCSIFWKQISLSKVVVFTILAGIAFMLDASTGVRSLLFNFYILPLISHVFITRGFSASLWRLLIILPFAIGIFYLSNSSNQTLFSTLSRIDMSVPLEIAMHYYPEYVVKEYPLQNTYFPNVLRPVLSMFMDMPEVNPGSAISKAVGFNAEGSYYAISIFGEAFLNFGMHTVLGYSAVWGISLIYIWMISCARFFRSFDAQIAIVITLSSILIVHGFEDYFAVRLLAAAKILLTATIANRVTSMIGASFIKRTRSQTA